MKLFIDNQQADIDQNTRVSVSLSIASLSQVESGRTGYTKTIRIPMTKRNMRLIGDPDQVNSVTMYNQQRHTARIEIDGFTVIDGAPHLISCMNEQGQAWYLINIIGASKLWVKQASESMFKEISIGFAETISPSKIVQSWSWDKPVKFLPVQRDRELVVNSNNFVFEPARILSFEDYHPFLHARSLLQAIMEQAGYKIVSDFIDSNYFDSFYISGNYPTKNVELIRSRMNFKAGKFANSSAIADRFGRVTADPSTSMNSVGNIVDTADPKALSGGTSGTTIEGVFSINNCFQKINNNIVFVAPSEVIIGFEYSFKYITDYYIVSREELLGFNTIYLEDMQAHSYKIVNRFADRRDQLVSGYSYSVIIFDHVATNQYQIRYELLTNPNADLENLKPSDYTTQTLKTFSTRVTQIVINSQYPILKTYIYAKKASESSFTPYTQDWAIYDGSTKERDTIEVEVTVRSSPTRVLPSKPKFFNGIYFGGAEEGMRFTLDKSTTLRPIFAPNPAVGTNVKFRDVAAHEIRQIDFVNSLKQLFNLYFYTDNLNKEVYIEPMNQFYSKAVIVDWSGRIDLSQPITVEELGADVHNKMTLLYQDGDGTVARWDETYQQKFGRWRASILNKFAKDGQAIYTNPVSRPSMNKTEVYPDADDALFLQVGDRSRYTSVDSEDLNFPPKIVRYLGQAALPANQRWGWPSYSTTYPAVVFHYAGKNNPYKDGDVPNPLSSFSDDSAVLLENGVSLCFEDRDGVAGLHRFYDTNINLYNNSKKVSVYLHLSPEDIEPLINPNELKHDFRARFRLKINGEYALFLLEEVCDYDPAGRSTKCIFIKDV